MSPAETKPAKKFQKADFPIFTETAAALEVSHKELAERLGYDSSVHSAWAKTGRIPRVCAIACEGLRRRAGQTEKVWIVKTTSKQQADTLQGIAKGLGMEVTGI